MFKFAWVLLSTAAYALPTETSNDTVLASSTNSSSGPSLPFTDPTTRTVFLWTSIALAVVTSVCQGLIVTIVAIAEDQGMWTFRFRIARYEHWWWTAVSTLLSTSFILIVLSFLSGNNNDSLGVLTLSTATAITIVRYAIPAWRNRDYIELRWLAWTGPSRTGIARTLGSFCGARADWMHIRGLRKQQKNAQTASDEWGWSIKPPKGIPQDPTALLKDLDESKLKRVVTTNGYLGRCVYDDGSSGGQVSLLWGEGEGFRRRVSRAITSMPAPLLASIPSTYDGFNGTGLCLAMGILGRNKGLAPWKLVFDMNDERKHKKGIVRTDPGKNIASELESESAWFPRPNKVMRSFYYKSLQEQYSGLGVEYVNASVELALILLDCPSSATKRFLDQHLEQQSIGVNQYMSNRQSLGTASVAGGSVAPILVATPKELDALYRSSYTSMIIALNHFDQENTVGDSHGEESLNTRRPDLSCFALLWVAEGGAEPQWWKDKWVQKRLEDESNSLKGNWKRGASWLLGLRDVPLLLDSWPKWP